jgi:N-acetylmuramic acid 6-phosphate (MurNAc-6-P) etherase
VKEAIVMRKSGVALDEARRLLDASEGSVRRALSLADGE